MEYAVGIPAITIDATLLFLETDPEKLSALQSEEERQEAAQISAWKEKGVQGVGVYAAM